jgi:hypothetical protein
MRIHRVKMSLSNLVSWFCCLLYFPKTWWTSSSESGEWSCSNNYVDYPPDDQQLLISFSKLKCWNKITEQHLEGVKMSNLYKGCIKTSYNDCRHFRLIAAICFEFWMPLKVGCAETSSFAVQTPALRQLGNKYVSIYKKPTQLEYLNVQLYCQYRYANIPAKCSQLLCHNVHSISEGQ